MHVRQACVTLTLRSTGSVIALCDRRWSWAEAITGVSFLDSGGGFRGAGGRAGEARVLPVMCVCFTVLYDGNREATSRSGSMAPGHRRACTPGWAAGFNQRLLRCRAM
jgi:hypothetical protein